MLQALRLEKLNVYDQIEIKPEKKRRNFLHESQVDGRPPVLTAISQSNGKGQTSTPHRIKTP